MEVGPKERPEMSVRIIILCCVKFQMRADINRYINFTNPLGKPRRRWKDNIKTALKRNGMRSMEWISLAQDRGKWQAHAVINIRVL